MPTASIRDVAKMAKVSTSTVSSVINNRPNVSTEIRRRVSEIIEKLEYRPRLPGRPSRSFAPSNGDGRDKAPTIRAAFVYAERDPEPASHNIVYNGWMQGINQALDASVKRLTVVAAASHVQRDPVCAQMLASRQIDGAIIAGIRPDDGYLDAFLNARLPIVVLNRRPSFGEFSSVNIDNYGAGVQVIDHLVQLGHRRIAIITQAMQQFQFAQERWEGCLRGCSAAGIEPAMVEHLSEECRLTPERARSLAQKLIDSRATALFAAEYVAAMVGDELQGLDVRIPHDISILGFDNRGLRLRNGQRLSSVGFDSLKMGELAGQMLLELLNDPQHIRRRTVRVSTTIYDYDTTAAIGEGAIQGSA